MKARLIGLIVLCFISSLLYAQADFRPGCLFLNNGDTLYGDIDYRGDVLMGQTCSFKKTGDEAKKVYYPSDILGYQFSNGKYFISKLIDGNPVFLEYLIQGEINIYYSRNDLNSTYYIDKEGLDFAEIPYSETTVVKDNKTYKVKSKSHIGFLNIYMNEAPNLAPKIERLEKPDHNSLIHLAQSYHNQVCLNKDCIIYNKRQKYSKVDLEILLGLADFHLEDEITVIGNLQYGVMAHFWMPRANEKVYFRTGLLYSVVHSENANGAIYKVPIQFEYQYPGTRIRPELALGFNLYLPGTITPAVHGGLNIKVYKSLFWSVKYDLDFKTSVSEEIKLDGIYSQAFSTGIYIDF